jgi:hypothetical protein
MASIRLSRTHRLGFGASAGAGNVKADVLERFVPRYQRVGFVDIIENSDWPK